MKRYLYHYILADLAKKMVFITGPRQVGKTWLAKQLMGDFAEPVYLNFDDIDDARNLSNPDKNQPSGRFCCCEVCAIGLKSAPAPGNCRYYNLSS